MKRCGLRYGLSVGIMPFRRAIMASEIIWNIFPSFGTMFAVTPAISSIVRIRSSVRIIRDGCAIMTSYRDIMSGWDSRMEGQSVRKKGVCDRMEGARIRVLVRRAIMAISRVLKDDALEKRFGIQIDCRRRRGLRETVWSPLN